MRFTGTLLLLFMFLPDAVCRQLSVQQYIDTYKDVAIREMKRGGVPASIILAQGILETENGNSDLVLRSNNHFGIKCKSNWSGESVFHNDDEEGECFRKYNSADESFRDHTNFLKGSARYAKLFALDITDYKGWAYGLKSAGYATNPKYPAILIKSIEKYNLHQYTLQGVSDKDIFSEGKYIDDRKTEQVVTIAPVISDDRAVLPGNNNKSSNKGVEAIFAKNETSLLAIATENEIALSKLLEYNDLDRDGLLSGDQWIYLEKKRKEGEQDIYVCKGSETLHSIAQANAVQMKQLQEYNNINGNPVLRTGTTIRLKQNAVSSAISETAVKTITEEKSFSRTIHEVLPKEGLYAISKKYNVSIEEIKEWNNLTSENLRVGQQLIINK